MNNRKKSKMIEEGVSIGILTVSDRCSQGQAKDESGPNLQHLVTTQGLIKGQVKQYNCVADELPVIKETLLQWCDEENLDMILTTGGTGFSLRDVTPEAVKQVIDREAPGLTTCMMTESLKVTPLAMLSRPVCGMRGQTLIITLPGSKKGSEECLRFVAPAIPHAIDLLVGRKTQVDKTHQTLQAEGVKCGNAVRHTHPHHHHHHMPHHHHHHHHHQYQDQTSNQESKADISKVSRRPRKSPYPMITVSKATEIILSHAERQGLKSVKLDEALGYVLAEDIYAKDPLPPFPASIKDGYAVLACDGEGVRRVKDDSTAGCRPDKVHLSSGECVRINTGAPVPPGADAVVQVEDTELLKEADDGCTELEIKILIDPVEGQDIRPLGCDIVEGERVLESGVLLGPAELGLLATVGVTEVMVVEKPVVAILSTGNELQHPGEPLKTGHIRDSNKTTLMALATQYGLPVVDAGIAPDNPPALLAKLKDAFIKADVLVTSGGVSMGERDILRPVLTSDFNATIHFAQVFMKPGKPTTFATCDYDGRKKVVLGLPGNPVSATVTATLYLLPLCRKMSGRADCHNTCIKTKLLSKVILDPRPEYHRGQLSWREGEQLPWASSTGNQLSSRLLSMASAQVLLKLPPGTPELSSLPAGWVVEAILLGL